MKLKDKTNFKEEPLMVLFFMSYTIKTLDNVIHLLYNVFRK